ncbi:MAG: RluA family pseudouridine synthase [Verrucomicrobia bacterium]|nr:RluA family pseudouridine synthase [Verrucomicrobiota bacterium]MBU1735488.1 RluA family pseudouridine synthase [Verrucomicrobiota bacterium]MBU1856883.1 RluA family pseudouridine synthase [Verrucomicrobiota bacterium]
MPEIVKTSNPKSEISNQVFIVPGNAAGTRLDIWLTCQAIACKANALSRARIQALIHDGHVTVNGQVIKEHHKIRPGDVVTLVIPPPVATALIPEAIPLDILYEDADLLVINKPAGLVVHPAAGHSSGTLVNALLHHCGSLAAIGGEQRPGIVHRLDRDTSGIMVVAKSDRALTGLMNQFKQRTIHKNYVALVWGHPNPVRGTIETLIGRHRADRKKMSVQPKTGRAAVTHYELSERFGDISLVRIRLETGRTHQIRVHMAHRGHSIVGDAQYGSRSSRSLPMPVGRQMLHAATLAFTHPVTGKSLTFTAPWPADLKALVTALRKPEPQPKQTPNAQTVRRQTSNWVAGIARVSDTKS